MTLQSEISLNKEQLRIKNAEIKKLEAKMIRSEDKVQYITIMNEKKFSDLQGLLDGKEEEVQYYQSLTANLMTRETQEGQKISEKKKAETPPPPEPTVEIKEVLSVDPKYKRKIETLQLRNEILTEKLELEKAEKEKFESEKRLLLKEVRRLQDKPETIDPLKNKISEMNTKADDLRKRYDDLVKEKEEIVRSYEEALKNAHEREEEGYPMGISEDASEELERMRDEREEMKYEIMKQKGKFEVRLNQEIRKIEDEWNQKIKKAKKANRKKAGGFDEGMSDDNQTPAWTTTYADMATLLLTFFILYYSVSAVNMQKFKEAILGEEQASIGLLELMDSVEIKESLEAITGLKKDDILSEINNVAEKEHFDKVMNVSTDRTKIVVRIPGQTLFEPGQAELNLEARPVLDEIIRLMKKYDNYQVNIQGHTDDTSVSGPRFPTNWELSAVRATAVLRYFLEKDIDPKRLTATGYSDVFPIATNQTEYGRSQNRRVEFVLEKEK